MRRMRMADRPGRTPVAARSWLLVAVSLVAAALAPSAFAEPAAAETCSLREVPAQAVTLARRGLDLRIFPGAQAIDRKFSGCQSVWMANGFLLAQATYRQGVVTKYVGSSPDGSRTVSCLYEAGRLAASAGDCPAFEEFPLNKSASAR
ncbi:hypothetical protein [Ideonella sp. YS5]|uniref:hypothetical protein n=1 Tax=Ideonella sp. YS5 TaxID=3453714 RepID=UPI003EEF7BD2